MFEASVGRRLHLHGHQGGSEATTSVFDDDQEGLGATTSLRVSS